MRAVEELTRGLVGLKWPEWKCKQVVLEVYRRVGVHLRPNFMPDDLGTLTAADVEAIMARAEDIFPRVPMRPLQMLDLVTFRLPEFDLIHHVGVILDPVSKTFIHSTEKTNVVIWRLHHVQKYVHSVHRYREWCA